MSPIFEVRSWRMARAGIAALLVLSTAAGAGAHEPPGLRALTGDAELVLRGRVVDLERAPGGLWHRFLVEEVLWPPAAQLEDDPPGPVLKVFAHGPGVPEGARLPVGEELVIGASRLAPPSPKQPHFLRRLWKGFRPERPGDRPALAAADGVVALTAEAEGAAPPLAEDVRRLVQGARGPLPASRRAGLFLEMAAHRLPAFREEALRQLSHPDAELDAEARQAARTLFRAEVEGPLDPGVLSAHLELAGAIRPARLGEILVPLIRKSPKEELGHRAAELLAAAGSPEDFRTLTTGFEEASAPEQARILRAVAASGREEHLALLGKGLSARSPLVRWTALVELGAHPSPLAAAPLKETAEAGEDPALRDAAVKALQRRPRPAPGDGAGAAGRIRLGPLLDAARRRMAREAEATGAEEGGR